MLKRRITFTLLSLILCTGLQLRADYAVETHCYEFHQESDTPAPAGYKPVYLSHYGRHGSRTGIDVGQMYQKVIRILSEAHDKNLLTQEGDSLLNEVRFVADFYKGMNGALTPVGEQEEHKLAELIFKRYTPVFKKGPKNIRVETTTVPRAIVSGECFVQTLTSLEPKLRFSFNTAEKYRDYINNDFPQGIKDEIRHILDSIDRQRISDGKEFCARIFKEPAKGGELIGDPDSFQKHIWDMASVGKSSGLATDIYRHLPIEVNKKWQGRSITKFYMRCLNSVEYGERRRKYSEPLVTVILEQARHVLGCKDRCADLKFGHDYPLLALAGYFGLDGFDQRLSWEDLPEAWNDPMNIPFASNMQIVFYRNDRTGDVLVKFVYNGRERKVKDLDPVVGPYYRWSEVYRHFLP